MNRFTKLDIKHATFLNNLAFADDDIKGYTMNFIDGKTMHECFDLDFTEFVLM